MLSRFQRYFEIFWLNIIIVFVLTGSNLLIPDNLVDKTYTFARPYEFDYFGWTLNALFVKLNQAAIDSPYYFDESARHQIVYDYLQLVERILQAEIQLNEVFTNPSISNPVAESAALRAELASLHSQQNLLASVAEAVLQEQISTALVVSSLSTVGQPFPPVLFHISPLPYDLIVSPRDKIQMETAISLIPELSIDSQVALEERVDHALDVSSLVVPVGGIGSYPTMVERSTTLDWLIEVIAHEWIHNWLGFRPLGMNYNSTSELRTMNETTASIAGHEIADLVIQYDYPELFAPPAGEEMNLMPYTVSPTDQPAPFDFSAEMYITRVHVDELLAQGKIDEAEFYMEQRRLFFWENGYPIRKLNQAYFAFYGAYADVPGGVAGQDPVGPAVCILRERSASLADFLHSIAGMTSFTELQAANSP